MSQVLEGNAAGELINAPGYGLLQAYGLTVPANGNQGYAPNCRFYLLGSSTGIYVNTGTLASSLFVADAQPTSLKNQPNGYMGLDSNGVASGRIVPRSGTLANIQALASTINEPEDGEMLYLTDLKLNALWNATNHAPDYYSRQITDFVPLYAPMGETSGNRFDMSGKGHLLTSINGVGSETGQCNSKRAVFTAASSQTLTTPDEAALKGGDIHLTIMGLTKVTSTSAACILNKGLGGTPGDAEYRIIYLSGTLCFYVDTGSATVFAGSAASINTLYFFVAQHNPRTNKVRISVSPLTGATMAAFSETSHSLGMQITTQNLIIGDQGFSAALYDGSLEELAIIKNYEVSDAEAEAFFQKVKAGRPLFR